MIENKNITERNIETHSTFHANENPITVLQCEMCLEYTRTEHPDYPFLDSGSQMVDMESSSTISTNQKE